MSIPDIPERELLARCIRGDKKAWDLFVFRYSKLIRHSLFQTLRGKNPSIQPQTLDDLHQEVFLALIADDYRKLRQFKGKNGCTLASWVRMIAIRKAIDHLRKEHPTISIEGNCTTSEHSTEYLNGKPSHQEKTIKSQEIRIVARVINELPPRYHFFVELFYRRGLSIKEISQIMGLDPNGVYQLHHRIKERIREILASEYPDLVAA